MKSGKLVLFGLRCAPRTESAVWTERFPPLVRSGELGIETFLKIDIPFVETE